MIIAIDGTSASGKGTLAKKIAAHFDFALLETGFLYRFVAWKMLDQTQGVYNEAVAIQIAQDFSAADIALFETVDLKASVVAENASKVAALPDVRAALLDFQRDFASHPPTGKNGAVLDGRDIGTFICPDAEIKFFVTASAEERARRRTLELQDLGQDVIFEQILVDLKARDARDMGRETAPLKQAEDACLIDTTALNPAEVLDFALAFVEKNQ
ncbi:MAG: (d)CMP kinase [Alphaproteobacteria bacterium]